MSYRGFYRNYPLLDNRLYGRLNEYAELNDVANKNNYIYANSVADNYRKRHDYHHDRPPRPSLYSLYSTPYAYPYVYPYTSPYLNPYLYPYATPYLNPYGYRYPYFP